MRNETRRKSVPVFCWEMLPPSPFFALQGNTIRSPKETASYAKNEDT